MAQIHWASAVSGTFTDASDWVGGIVPGESDDAILDPTGAAFKVTSSESEIVSGIQTAANATLWVARGSFTDTNGTDGGENAGTIAVSGATLVASGVIQNAGSIVFSGSSTEFEVASVGVTLTGGGAMVFKGSGGIFIDGTSLDNQDNTISGFVQTDVSTLLNGSNGTIDADGGSLGLTNGGTLTNEGLIENTGSRELGIGGYVFNNSGTIYATNSSTISVALDTIVGGTLTTTGSGLILSGSYIGPDGHETDGYFDGSTYQIDNDASVEVPNKYRLILGGAIQNGGTISIESSGAPTFLDVGGSGATLTGGGKIVLGNNVRNYMRSSTSTTETLTNVDNTISGVGSIGLGTLSLVNDAAGVVNATGAAAMVVETGGNDFTNAGLLESTGAGGFILRSSTVANSGTIFAATASKVTIQDSDIQGGVLGSDGTGMIRVSGAANILDGTSSAVEVTGQLVILAGAGLTGLGALELSGKIVAKGAATLDGPLANSGTLETAGGSFTALGAVTGAGQFIIAGGTMTFGSGFNQKVSFNGSGTLVLADSEGYTGTVWRFSTTGANSLDLEDIGFNDSTTASYSGTASGGILTVTDGTNTAKIALKGNYLSSTFTVANDGHGGTTVTDPKAPALAQAMAGFGATTVGPVAQGFVSAPPSNSLRLAVHG